MTWNVWQLPGPARFVDEIVAALYSGASVIAHAPASGTHGMAHALRERAADDEVLLWRTVDLTEHAGQRPGEVVASVLGGDAPRTPDALAQSAALEQMALWIEGATDADWASWGPFIERFAEAARTRAAGDAGAIGISLTGRARAHRVRGDAGLKLIRWRTRVSTLDVQLHLAMTLRRDSRASLEERLRMAIAGGLAGPDLEFAVDLAERPLADLLAPFELLKAEAAARGWCGKAGSESWEDGRTDELDGTAFEHGASLAAAGAHERIQQRLWHAELSVIFPELEERRIRLVGQLKAFLHPIQSRFGEIGRVDDLELSQIYQQIRGERLSAQTKNTVYHLTQLRNQLAHLEPVRADNLAGAGLVDGAVLTRRASGA